METLVEDIAPSTSAAPPKNRTRAIERFEPSPNLVYTIDMTARFVGLPRRTIAVCCKHGLVSSAIHPRNGYYFDQRAIQTLHRIESLRRVCGDAFPAIKIILDLTSQLERWQTDAHGTRESTRGSKRGNSQ